MDLRFELTLEGALEAANAAGDLAAHVSQSPRPLLERIAREWAEEDFPARIDRGGDPPWEPLSEISLKLRGNTRPLEGEGILRDSFEILEISDFSVVVGTEIGEIHHFGGKTSPDSMIPGREIPPRPFMTLDEALISEAVKRISEFYRGLES